MNWFGGTLKIQIDDKTYIHSVSTEEATLILESLKIKQAWYEPYPLYWSV